MKFLRWILFLPVGVLLVASCGSKERISGKPVDYWIENLEDREALTREKAATKILIYASDEIVEDNMPLLENMAKKELSSDIAMMIFNRTGRVYLECADIYASYLPYNQDGQKAIRKLAQTNADSAIEAINKDKTRDEGLNEQFYNDFFKEIFDR